MSRRDRISGRLWVHAAWLSQTPSAASESSPSTHSSLLPDITCMFPVAFFQSQCCLCAPPLLSHYLVHCCGATSRRGLCRFGPCFGPRTTLVLRHVTAQRYALLEKEYDRACAKIVDLDRQVCRCCRDAESGFPCLARSVCSHLDHLNEGVMTQWRLRRDEKHIEEVTHQGSHHA